MAEDKIVENAKGKRFKVKLEPVTKVQSGHWYCWVGPKKRPMGWNNKGGMDFILDGKAHQCNQGFKADASFYYIGFKADASFYDSPDPDYKWSWMNGFEYFRECVPVEKN